VFCGGARQLFAYNRFDKTYHRIHMRRKPCVGFSRLLFKSC
jgi:hypothetical protein